MERSNRRRQQDNNESIEHSRRVAELKDRHARFEEQAKRLQVFLATDRLPVVEVDGEDKFCENGYQLKSREEHNPVIRANTVYSRLHNSVNLTNKTKNYCRVLFFENTSEAFKNHMLHTSLKIWKYFSDHYESNDSNYILKVSKIFRTNSLQYYIFLDKFNVTSSMWHRIWNYDEINVQMVKEWIQQLSEAVEMLNVCGVAHRFIRPENLLFVKNNSNNNPLRVQLASFDMACIFYHYETNMPIFQKQGLPFDVDQSLLDHLPPECFESTYDASMVDVWSIGTIACLLLTRNNPFEGGETDWQEKWKKYWDRASINEDIRLLLDDIFQKADARITVFDLKNDRRLVNNTSAEPAKQNKKLPVLYYRIDLQKNINVNSNESRKQAPPCLLQHPTTFSPVIRDIFESVFYQKIENEAAMQEKGYFIHRNKSFSNEYKAFNFQDQYIRYEDSNQQDGLVKVYLLSKIPIRYRNMLLNESGKIMRYMSRDDIQIKANIHQVKEVFYSENKFYIFYESILHCQSLNQIFLESSPRKPSNDNIKQWMIQLSNAIDFMTFHAISHRYIRPEFVFVENFEKVKLTHFDMACFIRNPIENIQVLRNSGLQDECEYLWDHLPPECFAIKYDSYLVDIWSFGVVMLFCWFQKNPFTVPFTNEEAQTMWTDFKNPIDQTVYFNQIELLDKIFVPAGKRIRSGTLKKLTSFDDQKDSVLPPRSSSTTSDKTKSSIDDTSTESEITSLNGLSFRDSSNNLMKVARRETVTDLTSKLSSSSDTKIFSENN